jgi:hypothetical protein
MFRLDTLPAAVKAAPLMADPLAVTVVFWVCVKFIASPLPPLRVDEFRVRLFSPAAASTPSPAAFTIAFVSVTVLNCPDPV